MFTVQLSFSVALRAALFTKVAPKAHPQMTFEQ
jgi:hypothetical protein